jgi:uncharacterized delta-60 repeat protein
MFRSRMLKITAVMALLVLPHFATAQTCAGCLDPAFGNGGTQLIVTAGNGGTVQRDAVMQTDGKIVSLIENQTTQATLVRLNTDGSLDTTFAGDGIVETNWHYSTSLPRGFAYGLVIQNISGEERLVVAGSWTVPQGRNSSVTKLRVDRYMSDGSIDTTFGTNGTAIINHPYALSVSVQPADNKIITVGDLGAVVRLYPDGAVDNSFGGSGNGATGAGQAGWSIKATLDGKILIGGTYSQGPDSLMCVSRLNTNGSVDINFGSNGRAVANFFGRGSFGRAFRVDTDPYGNIIAGGIARRKGAGLNDNDFAAARFTSSGQPDASFNGTGRVNYYFAGLNGSGRSVVAQADGKVIVSGASGLASGSYDFTLIRYNYDGTIDTAFGSNGITATDIDATDYSFSARTWFDPTCSCEKIVMAGSSLTGASFARYFTN